MMICDGGGIVKENKIKVAMITNHFGITGIGTVMMNYCKALDKDKYDLTILAGQPISEKYAKECKEYGIHLIALPSRHGESLKHYSALWKALKAEHYDIVHVHGSSSMMAIELTIASLAGVKVRIAHCHTKVEVIKWTYRVLMPFFKQSYTKGLACSRLAGEWVFGKDNFQVITNGFDTKSFTYDDEARLNIRRRLNIEDNFVVGHVGRFNPQKNQKFLLDVFREIAKIRSDAILLLVGTGPDFEKIKELVNGHPHKDRIILYGESDVINQLYSAMDVFVFPSRYEGLGLVAVEAQISGLPCVVSDVVPKEVVISDNIDFLSLDEPISTWSNAIVSKPVTREYREEFYGNNQRSILNYDINHCVDTLDKVYQQMANKKIIASECDK